MSAISEFKISNKVRQPLFDNPLKAQAGPILRRLKYICREEGGDLVSICLAAGISPSEFEQLDKGHHYYDPMKLDTDEIAWYISAVLLRCGASLEDIFGKYFPANQMRRHLRWHKVMLPGFHAEGERVLLAVKEMELVFKQAQKAKQTFRRAYQAVKHQLKTKESELRRIWVDVCELSLWAGYLTRSNTRGTLQFNNPHVIQPRPRGDGLVKCLCMKCRQVVLISDQDLFRLNDGVRSCRECSRKAVGEAGKVHFVVDVQTGYKYWNIATAYFQLGLDKGDNYIPRTTFYRQLTQRKVLYVAGTYLWLKKRETKTMSTEVRKKLVDLGMPEGFQVPIRHLSATQMMQHKLNLRKKHTAKRKRAALRRKRLWLEKLVTRTDIHNYREYMIERGKQSRAQTWAEDTINK